MKKKGGQVGEQGNFDGCPSTEPRPVPRGALFKELLAAATKLEPSAARLAHLSLV